MRSPIARFAAPVIFSVALVIALPTQAFASAPWSANCPNVPTSKVCIYSDWNWTGQIGNMGGDNLSYVGETYPSSGTAVDNSISSNKNLYTSLDVLWHRQTNFGGEAACTNSGTGFYFVGLYWNDDFSSHNVTGNQC